MNVRRCLLICLAIAGASSASAASPPPAAPVAPESMQLITLGTGGGPRLRVKRSHPANALVLGTGEIALVDAGEGLFERMAQAKLNIADVKAIYITHLHSDHVGAVSALLSARWHMGVFEPLDIIGPPRTKEYIAKLVEANAPVVDVTRSPSRLPLRDPPLGETVRVTEVSPPADGSSVSIPSSLFRSVKAVQNSHFSLVTDAGHSLPLSYRFDVQGRSIVFTGDTGPSRAIERLAKDADILVGELSDYALMRTTASTINVSAGMTEKAHQDAFTKAHLLPQALAEMANSAGVKALIASHILPGMDNDADRELPLLSEMNRFYKGPIIIADDLDRF